MATFSSHGMIALGMMIYLTVIKRKEEVNECRERNDPDRSSSIEGSKRVDFTVCCRRKSYAMVVLVLFKRSGQRTSAVKDVVFGEIRRVFCACHSLTVPPFFT